MSTPIVEPGPDVVTAAPVSKDAVRAVLRSARPRGKSAWWGIGSGTLSALSIVALMACSAFLIARAAEMPALMYISLVVVGVRGFALGRAFFRYLERLFSHDAAFRQLETVRVSLLERLIPLAPAGLRRSGRGNLLSTLVSDVDELQNLGLRVIQPLIISVSVAAISVIAIGFINVGAALVLLACLVAGVLIAMFAITRVSADAERALAPRRARLLDALLDYLENLDVLVAFGADRTARARVDEADRDLTAALTRRASGAGIAAGALALFSGLAIAGTMIAAIPALQDGLTGPWFTVLALVPLAVFEVVAMVPLALSALRQVRASAERIADATAPERSAGLAPETGSLELAPVAGAPAIALHDLTVRWPGAQRDALRVADLRVAVGETLLIEGPSGAGKTTLAHALVRFVESSGQYLLDGQDVHGLHPDAVRTRVGLCEQSPYLFDESIRQNLLFAREDATDAELTEVLDRVGLGSWARARGGLDARVGERGSLVSGGQAQRIALARALLHDFPIIVLDEPTANVENDLAAVLLDELLGAARSADRTVLVISHADVNPLLIDRRVRIQDGVLIADSRA